MQEFTCGAFNLSEDNRDLAKEMKVQLVVWNPAVQQDPNNPDTIQVVAEEDYGFDDVTEIVAPPDHAVDVTLVENKDRAKNAPLYAFNNNAQLEATPERVAAVGTSYTFEVSNTNSGVL